MLRYWFLMTLLTKSSIDILHKESTLQDKSNTTKINIITTIRTYYAKTKKNSTQNPCKIHQTP